MESLASFEEDESIFRLSTLCDSVWRTSEATGEKPASIRTLNDFLAERGVTDDALFENEFAPMEHSASVLKRNLDDCQSLVDHASAVASAIESLKAEITTFNSCASSLKDDADSVRLEHERLAAEMLQVRAMLQPFTQLDAAARNLNSSGIEAPVAAETLRNLAVVATGLELASRTGVRDAAVYAARLQQLRSRALGILRTHISEKLKSAADVAAQQMRTTQTGSGGLIDSSVFQVPFHAVANTLRPLIAELESHADTADGASVLNDVYTTFAQLRTSLLLPVAKMLVDAVAESDLDTLIRAGAARIAQLCRGEFSLAACLFELPSATINQVQEKICSILAGVARPRVIRASHLDQLCSVVDALMDVTADCENSGESAAIPTITCRKLLADAQERLIFRANSYIVSNVASVPATSSLDYPAVLSKEGADTGYPPIESAAVILRICSGRVECSVFSGLAQNTVSSAITKLNESARVISKTAGAVDGHLFTIRQLLRLKEAIEPFDSRVGSVEELALDFSDVRAAFGELFRARSLFQMNRTNPLLALARGPHVTHAHVDVKDHIAEMLQTACSQVILLVTRILLDTSIVILTPEASPADAGRLTDVATRFSASVNDIFPTVASKIVLYVGSKRGRQLLEPIMTSIQETASKLRAAYPAIENSLPSDASIQSTFDEILLSTTTE